LTVDGVCVPISQTQPTPPTANAGPDQTVTNGSTVMLNGAGSTATTPGATVTGYSWTQTAGPAVSLSGANTVTSTFIAPTVTTQSVLIFSLTVTDSNGQVSSPSTTQVTVNAP
jgi:K319-like protein